MRGEEPSSNSCEFAGFNVNSDENGDKIGDKNSANSDSNGSNTYRVACSDHVDNILALQQNNNEEIPTFGNVSVVNSADIHFGNKTIIQGPVTINQISYSADEENSSTSDSDNCLKTEYNSTKSEKGVFNPTFYDESGKNEKNYVINELCDNNILDVKKDYQGFAWEQVSKRCVLLFAFMALLMLILTILMVVFLLKQNTRNQNAAVDEENQEPLYYELDKNITLSNKLRMVTRTEWLAQPPLDQITDLKTPVPYVIIHHTAADNCTSQAQCVFRVRLIQQFHIESRGWNDIGYNFLVGGDGSAYEGRGWAKEGAHLLGYNSKSIGIAFIGTFMLFKPPSYQINVCKILIEEGVKKGFIAKDYKLFAARQLFTTESPGMPLYDDIKTWDHWAVKP